MIINKEGKEYSILGKEIPQNFYSNMFKPDEYYYVVFRNKKMIKGDLGYYNGEIDIDIDDKDVKPTYINQKLGVVIKLTKPLEIEKWEVDDEWC